MQEITLNKQHKDRLFRMVFHDKRDLLCLYNAVNKSCHTDPEALEITTLEDVIYMSMKNDVSFLLGNVLNLWEHQSSYNPNMPVRGLLYFARLYRRYIEANRIDIFSSRLKKLPFPQYIVFYNGLRDEPEQVELRLSEAFAQPTDGKEYNPSLEVRVLMLNINLGKNRELMDQCRRLKDYASFVAAVRRNQQSGMEIEAAVSKAIETCIRRGILADILSVHRAEVIEMFLTDYNAELHMELVREENREEGRMEGEQRKLIQMVCRKLRRGKKPEEIAEELDEEAAVIWPICETAAEMTPDYDEESIYERLNKR